MSTPSLPTLDDVFLKLTGHVIRDTDADKLAATRMHAAMFRGGGRR